MKVHIAASWLSVFTSGGTLVCCALPAALVAAGAGAALSTLVVQVPQLIWFSEHKVPVFLAAGLMLGVAGWAQHRARQMACPPDAERAAACAVTRDVSVWVYWSSCAIFVVGRFFAFVAPLLLG